jgi:hypothetical protein
MIKQKNLDHLSALAQFSVVYTLVYMLLESILTRIGLAWWFFGIIFIFIGVVLYFFLKDGWILDYIADYVIYVGISFILYDISSVIIVFLT